MLPLVTRRLGSSGFDGVEILMLVVGVAIVVAIALVL